MIAYNLFRISVSFIISDLISVSFSSNSWYSEHKFSFGLDLSSHSSRASRIFIFCIKSWAAFSRGRINSRTLDILPSATSARKNSCLIYLLYTISKKNIIINNYRKTRLALSFVSSLPSSICLWELWYWIYSRREKARFPFCNLWKNWRQM